MIKPLIKGLALLLVTAFLLTAFGLSIYNVVELKRLKSITAPEPSFDKTAHADVIEAFEMLEKDDNFLNQIGKMHVITGFKENVAGVKNFIEENLPVYRVSLITVDGRLFFDSAYPQKTHNGNQVYTEIALLEASINGSADELTELAIENHETRPEISETIRFNDIRSATRQSATTRKNSFYFAKRFDHVVLRLTKEE